MQLIPKNWHTFQHYNKRNPPWIKLHRALLDDYDFSQLPVESRALAPMLWLIASEAKDGVINMTPEALAFRLHIDYMTLVNGLEPLMNKGFFLDASNVLASRKQSATPETETETEKSANQESETNGGTRTPKASTGADSLVGGALKHSRSAGFEIPEIEAAS